MVARQQHQHQQHQHSRRERERESSRLLGSAERSISSGSKKKTRKETTRKNRLLTRETVGRQSAKLWWPSCELSRPSKTEARYQASLERAWSAQERARLFWSVQSVQTTGSHHHHRGFFLQPTATGKSWLADTIGTEGPRSSITTYFHSYPFVPGGAVSLPPPLLNSINNAAAAAITPAGLVGHLFGGQQACNLACSCTCTSNVANCNPHHHQHHHHQHQQHQQQQQHHQHHHQQQQHHHRPIGATVLLQPVEHIKDTMVSQLFVT
ncbi:uncharacterized protein LOC143358821 [Halictus rubicundus]|uniref:uncharacterized protein LOC143358821 n=1 Tax=Halictus rubicundus TaxID=77578 RepID=UPI0040363BE9